MVEWHFITDWYNWAIHKTRIRKWEKTILAAWWRNDILMQNTWLKDSNWKEIFESDVVYLAWYWDYICEFPFLQLYESSFEWDIGEIKGNIYENENLIDNK